jgi:hypothetical protein
MKKITLLFLYMVYCHSISAQVKNRFAIGFNLQPILENSYEGIGEFKVTDHWAVSGKFGYAGKANFMRINFEYKSYGVNERISYGYFSKLGIKYTFNNNVYIMASLIMSKYRNSLTTIDAMDQVWHTEGSGITWNPGITAGYRLTIIKEHLFLDAGGQLSLNINDDNFQYYSPGQGCFLMLPVRLQGVMALMVAF